MNKSRLKKQISAVGKLAALLLLQGILRCFKLLFAKRKLLFVTNQKIRTVTLGPTSQICIIGLFLWMGGVFVQSLRYHDIISSKEQEITRLESLNNFFEEEFSNVNEKLVKVSEYLISIHGESHQVKAVEVPSTLRTPKNIKEKDFSEGDKETYNQIKNVDDKINGIRSMALTRINKIESAIILTGLNIKKLPQKISNKNKSGAEIKEISLNKAGSVKGQGGPLVKAMDIENDGSLDSAMSLRNSGSENNLERHMAKLKFTSEIDYLMVLERLAEVMPLARPMKNYYISSGFGSRVDPLTGHSATHQGLDFVGPNKEKVLSPSVGKVILAGQFSDYGNAIVIDHGFGITTRYGHLSKVNVVEGQMVKKGDVIALQGNTGRSTGSHLHYEVRYKNTPLNPRKFLEAGDSLFNDEKITHHVNS